MTDEQRRQVVSFRAQRSFPLHATPHYADGARTYLLSAAGFEHQPIMNLPMRRDEFEGKLLKVAIKGAGAEVFAWCILQNHWHLLAKVDLQMFGIVIGRLHNGTATQWNREDRCPGRRVWYRFADRRIRNERHFWSAVNYIHANPVHHHLVANSNEWKTSSLQLYLDEYGREYMVKLWREYPVQHMGDKWDSEETEEHASRR